jgi:BirA family transcriptional regulator, biotin operon repressor / biotin---[acetyl-CoA-carboxylase] ligase
MNQLTGIASLDTEHKRNQVLFRLIKAYQQGEFVSGNDLSEILGVSRTAVWKYMRNYEDLGFEIESIPRLGYRLKSLPDIPVEPILSLYLPDDVSLGRVVHWFSQVDSTNTVASRLSRDGAHHGTIVGALEQTGGRGRRGRVWFSPKEGLWFSLILKRPIPLARAAEITLLASIAVRRAVMSLTGLPIQIKWPNDLLCHGKKVCGILAEIRADGETVHSVILGIGINCNSPAEDFPQELRDIATSLFVEAQHAVNRAELLARVLSEFEPMYNGLAVGKSGFRDVSEEWRAASATLGRRIRVQTASEVIDGFATGMSDSGILYVTDDSGTVHAVHSGDVLF